MRGNLPQEIKELLLKLEGMDPGLPKADKCSLLQNRDYDSKDLKKKKKKKQRQGRLHGQKAAPFRSLFIRIRSYFVIERIE